MGYSEKMNKVIEDIRVYNSDNIKGNITLLDNVGDACITWSSSDEAFVCSHDKGVMKKGVVTRGADDKKVTLTANIVLGDEKAEVSFDVIVRAANKKISDEDFVGYLFGHFIGEETKDSEQIYFAISEGGFIFKDMNGGKPVLISEVGERGVRDPYICRSFEGDRFFLIATDLSINHRGGWFKNEQGYYDPSTTGSQYLVLWESEDLVNWTDARLIDVAPANAGMAWAPEMIYSEETGEYVIFFSSSIMNPETKYKAKPNTIYYVTTRDFVHFSDTKIFIDNQTDGESDGKRREIIDTTVLRVNDTYYAVSKDGDNEEANGGIRIHKTKNLLDEKSWVKVLDLDELDIDLSGHSDVKRLDNGLLEGPELFELNIKDRSNADVPEYGIIADQYSIDGGYLPIVTTDLEDIDNSKGSWKLLGENEYSFDKLKKRHGTIMRITKEELDRLKDKFLK